MTGRVAQSDPDLVASAAIEALMDARWESSDLLSRRPSQLAPDLLRGHAAELAGSAIGRDQVLSAALDAAARDLEAGCAPLRDGALFFFQEALPAKAARDTVREATLRQGGVPIAESQRIADEIEQRHRAQCIEVRELSQRLAAEARLHELLWDDPRLPADGRTRLVMLCSVPRLIERAEALDPNRVRRLRTGDATGTAFRLLDQNLRDASREGGRMHALPSFAPMGDVKRPSHVWSAAAGWFLLVCMFAAVLVELIGIG